MFKKLFFFCVTALLCSAISAQTVVLTFSGRDALDRYIQLNRVTVSNLTRGWQETLIWPDTILTLQQGSGIDEMETSNALQLLQNNPNPFNGTTQLNLSLANAGRVTLEIADVIGRTVVVTNDFSSLQAGYHQFQITLSKTGTYVATVRQDGKSASIKMLCNGGGNADRIEYTGTVQPNEYLAIQAKSLTRGVSDNLFVPGDQMEYVGYATFSGSEFASQTISQEQQGSESFRLRFDPVMSDPTDGQPCPSTPTLTDIDGNVYNTVQLGSQCWMQQNLRTKHTADGAPISMGAGASDVKMLYYYPDSNASNQEDYGLLYNWVAVMNGAESSFSVPSNVQGICPDGWHVPSLQEWQTLISYVSTQGQYTCGGNNIGKALAGTSGWLNNPSSPEPMCEIGYHPERNNATNFTGMPAGNFVGTRITNFGKYAIFWSSTSCDSSNVSVLYLAYTNVTTLHIPIGGHNKTYGESVRCVRNEGNTGGGGGQGGGGGTNVSGSCTVSYVNANETGSGGQITSVKDYDNNSYSVVQIGSQCWMQQNLRTRHYADGTQIRQGSNTPFPLTTSTSYWFYPADNSSYEAIYGLLYNWKAAIRTLSDASTSNPSGVQGICPNGWHLPSAAEYAQLTEYVMNQDEYICNPDNRDYVSYAFASNDYWESSPIPCSPGYNPSSNNATGFDALPAGQWAETTSLVNRCASFWGASANNNYQNAYSWNLMMGHPYPVVSYDMSEWGYSVRCVRD